MIGEVPESAITLTSTVPVPAGAVAIMEVGETTEYCSAEIDPKRTFCTSEKLSPVMVTDVPPSVGPIFGLIVSMVGSGCFVAD